MAPNRQGRAVKLRTMCSLVSTVVCACVSVRTPVRVVQLRVHGVCVHMSPALCMIKCLHVCTLVFMVCV